MKKVPLERITILEKAIVICFIDDFTGSMAAGKIRTIFRDADGQEVKVRLSRNPSGYYIVSPSAGGEPNNIDVYSDYYRDERNIAIARAPKPAEIRLKPGLSYPFRLNTPLARVTLLQALDGQPAGNIEVKAFALPKANYNLELVSLNNNSLRIKYLGTSPAVKAGYVLSVNGTEILVTGGRENIKGEATIDYSGNEPSWNPADPVEVVAVEILNTVSDRNGDFVVYFKQYDFEGQSIKFQLKLADQNLHIEGNDPFEGLIPERKELILKLRVTG